MSTDIRGHEALLHHHHHYHHHCDGDGAALGIVRYSKGRNSVADPWLVNLNDEPESKFLYIETIKLYCIVLYCSLSLSQPPPS